LKIKRKHILNIINKETLLDMHYAFTSRKINIYIRKLYPSWYRNNKYYSIMLFFILLCKKFFDLNRFRSFPKEIPILLLAYTGNQRAAISSINKNRNDSEIFGDYGFGDFSFPIYKSYYLSLPYFSEILKIYTNSTNYFRLSFNYIYHEYWLTYGHFIMLIKFLKSVNAKLVVVSNDHYLRTRIIPYVCDFIGIKSVYIQHASVSLDFPNLIFNFALLEGRDSFDKYLQIGKIESVVFLLGSLKESGSDKICTRKRVSNIGICFGLIDDVNKVEKLIQEVLKSFDCSDIFLRPHPREKRVLFVKEMLAKYNLGFSDSNQEKVSDFLNNVECIIASESNIHLEAILQNIYSIYYRLTEEGKHKYDYYGFLSNNLISDFTDINLLREVLLRLKNNKPNVRHLAQYYNDTIGTEFEGQSAVLYDEVISYIKTENTNFIDKTFNVENVNGVKVYSLR
jgi:hypothetical protein